MERKEAHDEWKAEQRAEREAARAEREAAREAAGRARGRTGGREGRPRARARQLTSAEDVPSRCIDVAPAVIRSATDDEDFPNSHQPLTHGFTNAMLRP